MSITAGETYGTRQKPVLNAEGVEYGRHSITSTFKSFGLGRRSGVNP
jgi:hypothetical protein